MSRTSLTRAPAGKGKGGSSDRLPLGRADLLLILGFWTFLAALTALNRVMDPRAGGPFQPVTPSAPIAMALLQAYLWALITPAVFWLAGRFGPERSTRWVRILVLLGVGLLVAIAMDRVSFALRSHFYAFQPRGGSAAASPTAGRGGPSGAWFAISHLWFLPNLVIYMAVLAAGFARDYFGRYRVREAESVRLQAEAARLHAQLAEARLSALRTQLDPHFLFNTLNAVSALVERDPRGVRRMISRLSELLRASLEGGDAPEVPLEKELEFIGRYLEIMQIRFQGSLSVETSAPPELADALVPSLVLQPLVENAIKHGVRRSEGVGRIAIAARRDDGRLVLSVEDSGPGPDAATPEAGGGVGLRNTRERLEALYGDAQSLTLRPAEGGGTVAEVVLPYHTATGAAATDALGAVVGR